MMKKRPGSMESGFELRFTDYFLKQFGSYKEKEKGIINDKLSLIKEKPFRFERHEGFKFVFKVKITVDDKFSRLMYAVFYPDAEHITILGVFDRKADYKDFERVFKELRK